MTTVQHTECDSCGNVIPEPTDPMWILCGRINAGLRIDICHACFANLKPRTILANARKRGVNLGE